jgi:hypothetical protein
MSSSDHVGVAASTTSSSSDSVALTSPRSDQYMALLKKSREQSSALASVRVRGFVYVAEPLNDPPLMVVDLSNLPDIEKLKQQQQLAMATTTTPTTRSVVLEAVLRRFVVAICRNVRIAAFSATTLPPSSCTRCRSAPPSPGFVAPTLCSIAPTRKISNNSTSSTPRAGFAFSSRSRGPSFRPSSGARCSISFAPISTSDRVSPLSHVLAASPCRRSCSTSPPPPPRALRCDSRCLPRRSACCAVPPTTARSSTTPCRRSVVSVAGLSVSTYPRGADGRLGQPIADHFRVDACDKACFLACIADGCGWGRKASLASDLACNTFVQTLKNELTVTPETTVQLTDVADSLIQSLLAADAAIGKGTTGPREECGTTTLCGVAVLRAAIAPRRHRRRRRRPFVVALISVGDCKAYLRRAATGAIEDVTLGNRPVLGNAHDPGGRIGPAVDVRDADLRNVVSALCHQLRQRRCVDAGERRRRRQHRSGLHEGAVHVPGAGSWDEVPAERQQFSLRLLERIVNESKSCRRHCERRGRPLRAPVAAARRFHGGASQRSPAAGFGGQAGSHHVLRDAFRAVCRAGDRPVRAVP